MLLRQWVFLFLWVVISSTLGLSITSSQYGTASVHVGNMRFEAAMYTVTFDHNVGLATSPFTPLSELPLSGGGEEDFMPQAMTMQMGAATLVCPGNVEYSSVMTSPVADGPPATFLPMPAVHESASTLFRIFAGLSVAESVQPLPNTFIGIKILRNFNEWNKEWQDYVPPHLDMSQCRVRLDALRDLETATTLSSPLLGPIPTPYRPPCDIEQLNALIANLYTSLDAIGQGVGGRHSLEQHTWVVASFQLRDPWIGCNALVDDLVLRGPVQKTFPATKQCLERDPFSAAWLADPCCNHALAFSQCCVPRPITHTVEGVIGVATQHITEQCQHPDAITRVLRAHVRNQVENARCDIGTADWDTMEDLMRFVQTCQEELFGKPPGSPPTCVADSDCYTSCDTQRGECIQPWDDPSPYLLACFADHIDPIVERTWRKQWGLTGQSTMDQFRQAMQDHLFSPQCVGPTGWQHQDDPEGCVAETRCNWKPEATTAEECSVGQLFCGECHAGQCWSVTEKPSCFTWTSAVIQEIPELSHSRDACLPPELCGSTESWCPPRCYNATTMAVIPNIWSPASCEATWFPGRGYRAGSFDTQERCAQGRCSVDPRLDATQCASISSCSRGCTRCRPVQWGKTVCRSTTITNATACTNGGYWNTEHGGFCEYEHLRTAEECTALSAENVFEACETLSDSDCHAGTTHLACYLNRWDHCESQEACEQSGECDDWNLQNWFNPECWNGNSADATQGGCLGVCVFPFSTMTHCPPEMGWSRLGCIDYSITDPAVCALNGTWHQRAFTAEDCVGHGYGCREKGNWGMLSPKQGTQCTGCDRGNTIEPYYRWHGGTWHTGYMQPLQWVNSTFGPVNAWVPSLNWTKLHEQVENAAAVIIAQSIKSGLQCKYGMIASTMKVIACDCGGGTNCFTSANAFIPVGEQDFYAGIASNVDWGTIHLSIPEGAIPVGLDSEPVKANATSSLDIIFVPQQGARKGKRSPYDPNEYETVTNHVDYIVGQLVGAGASLSLPEGGLEEPILLCIDVDPEIPYDPESLYPVRDFAGYTAVPTPKWWPLNKDIVVVGENLQFCANITESGTFFPILRLEDWESATGVATTTTTTTTPTTAAATILSDGAIVAIVLGSVLGCALFALLITLCCYMSKYNTKTYQRLQEPIVYNDHRRRPYHQTMRKILFKKK